ncbi:DNA adenine methylase [Levilactobacillus tangyuanensis]|uniref:site-specific DNA-methyltransferase (adenine-specific) n=1 Tax=Levilactobacillus tangyuanensis TaxID=2486021 RepID=A0ABW1TRC5_9LACO|nr:Dam family site-specific DNA-(adenine-N6)-methyltransferase [Levilactobacillus tangyuanensis]
MAADSELFPVITPIIKWAGGKKKLAPTIEQAASHQIDFSTIDTYVEPFAGGASMLLYLATKYRFKHQVILDINPELINLYRQVRDHLNDLMTGLTAIQATYNALPDLATQKENFYAVRSAFNQGILAGEASVDQAVRFMFLNKTDFNGLYRVNAKGTFNVPFGQRKQVNLFEATNLTDFSRLLQNTEILLGDYRQTAQYAGPKTFFYFDPPYRPLSDSASFTSYAKSSFNDDAQVELAGFTQQLAAKEAHFALSNSDPHQSDPDDNFFDDLYADFTIQRIQAARMISARAKGRGNVSELLVIH